MEIIVRREEGREMREDGRWEVGDATATRLWEEEGLACGQSDRRLTTV
jgi:hypothetical protein